MPIDEKLEGPQSIYTEKITALLKNWPPQRSFPMEDDKSPVHLRCISTSTNPTYVGIEQWMEIAAPVDTVKLVLDDFANYKNLFSGFDDVHVIHRDLVHGNKLVLYWEQHIPVLPNVSYEMNYILGQLGKDRYYYRYQLHEGRSIRFRDGLIVIEKVKPGITRYTEYDFFEANWGMLSLSKERIWKESVEGIFLSDVAIALKSQNLSMSYDAIREKSKKRLEQFPVETCIQNRKSW